MTDRQTVIEAITSLQGWLRPGQAEMLWDQASATPNGATIVEIGSFQGKSTVVLASAAPPEAKVYAIDPHAGNDRGPGEWEADPADAQADYVAFLDNLDRYRVADRVIHVRSFSQDAHDAVPGEIDFLYIDGAHGYAPALSDIQGWGERVTAGGAMAIHDVYTSVFVTLAVARSLWLSSDWRYVGRHRSMSLYVRESVKGRARVENIARQVGNAPWFAFNALVRGLDLVGLHGLSRRGQGPGGGVY